MTNHSLLTKACAFLSRARFQSQEGAGSSSLDDMEEIPLGNNATSSENNPSQPQLFASSSFSNLPSEPSPFDNLGGVGTSGVGNEPQDHGMLSASIASSTSHSRQSSEGNVKFIVGSTDNSATASPMHFGRLGTNSATNSPASLNQGSADSPAFHGSAATSQRGFVPQTTMPVEVPDPELRPVQMSSPECPGPLSSPSTERDQPQSAESHASVDRHDRSPSSASSHHSTAARPGSTTSDGLVHSAVSPESSMSSQSGLAMSSGVDLQRSPSVQSTHSSSITQSRPSEPGSPWHALHPHGLPSAQPHDLPAMEIQRGDGPAPGSHPTPPLQGDPTRAPSAGNPYCTASTIPSVLESQDNALSPPHSNASSAGQAHAGNVIDANHNDMVANVPTPEDAQPAHTSTQQELEASQQQQVLDIYATPIQAHPQSAFYPLAKTEHVEPQLPGEQHSMPTSSVMSSPSQHVPPVSHSLQNVSVSASQTFPVTSQPVGPQQSAFPADHTKPSEASYKESLSYQVHKSRGEHNMSPAATLWHNPELGTGAVKLAPAAPSPLSSSHGSDTQSPLVSPTQKVQPLSLPNIREMSEQVQEGIGIGAPGSQQLPSLPQGEQVQKAGQVHPRPELPQDQHQAAQRLQVGESSQCTQLHSAAASAPASSVAMAVPPHTSVSPTVHAASSVPSTGGHAALSEHPVQHTGATVPQAQYAAQTNNQNQARGAGQQLNINQGAQVPAGQNVVPSHLGQNVALHSMQMGQNVASSQMSQNAGPSQVAQNVAPQVAQSAAPAQVSQNIQPQRLGQDVPPPQMGQNVAPPQSGQHVTPQIGQDLTNQHTTQGIASQQMTQHVAPPQVGQHVIPPQAGQHVAPPQMSQNVAPQHTGQSVIPQQAGGILPPQSPQATTSPGIAYAAEFLPPTEEVVQQQEAHGRKSVDSITDEISKGLDPGDSQSTPQPADQALQPVYSQEPPPQVGSQYPPQDHSLKDEPAQGPSQERDSRSRNPPKSNHGWDPQDSERGRDPRESDHGSTQRDQWDARRDPRHDPDWHRDPYDRRWEDSRYDDRYRDPRYDRYHDPYRQPPSRSTSYDDYYRPRSQQGYGESYERPRSRQSYVADPDNRPRSRQGYPEHPDRPRSRQGYPEHPDRPRSRQGYPEQAERPHSRQGYVDDGYSQRYNRPNSRQEAYHTNSHRQGYPGGKIFVGIGM